MLNVHFDLNRTLRTSSADLAYLTAKSGLWVAKLAAKVALKGGAMIATSLANRFFPKCDGCHGRIYITTPVTLKGRTFHRVCADNLENVDLALADELFPACSICMVRMYDGLTTTPCNHTFHQICLDRWKETHNTCPLDRSLLNPNANANNQSVIEVLQESIALQNIRLALRLHEMRNEQSALQAFLNLQQENQPTIHLENLRLSMNHQRAVINQIEREFKSHGPQRYRRVLSWTRRGHREHIMAIILDKLGYNTVQKKESIFDLLSPEVKAELPEFETIHLNRRFDLYEDEVKVQDSYPHSWEFTSHFGGSD